jgi:hypothetical protein
MLTFWILVGVLFLGWLIVNLPRRRSDGDLVERVHPYRRMLPHMMVGRNESIVLYDDYVKAEALLEYIPRAKAAFGFDVDITHCLVAAVARGHRDNPKMGQFIAGRRLYHRKHIDLTFSLKRKRLDKEAKLSAVKLRFTGNEPLRDTCERINAKVVIERSGAETYTDKELGFFTRLPRPILSFCIKSVRWADYHNLLPASFIENDGFYCSTFVANLGSVGMNAGFHHLYEYGTCPLFLMVGRIEDRPWVDDGKVVVRKILHLRYSYDERIDDGLTSKGGIDSVRHVLENPDEVFGSLPPVAAAPPAPASPPVPAAPAQGAAGGEGAA